MGDQKQAWSVGPAAIYGKHSGLLLFVLGEDKSSIVRVGDCVRRRSLNKGSKLGREGEYPEHHVGCKKPRMFVRQSCGVFVEWTARKRAVLADKTPAGHREEHAALCGWKLWVSHDPQEACTRRMPKVGDKISVLSGVNLEAEVVSVDTEKRTCEVVIRGVRA